MKTASIIALVVVASIISFSLGSSGGYGSMLLIMMGGYAAIITLPIATVVCAVSAVIFAISAKASKTQANWKFFFKLAVGTYVLAVLVAIVMVFEALSRAHF